MNMTAVFEFVKLFLGSFFSCRGGVFGIFYNDGYKEAFETYFATFSTGEKAVSMIFIILIAVVLIAQCN